MIYYYIIFLMELSIYILNGVCLVKLNVTDINLVFYFLTILTLFGNRLYKGGNHKGEKSFQEFLIYHRDILQNVQM